MLQTIQEKRPVSKVSSLYCAWTTRDDSPNSPLIAVWIDSSMRGFEGEFALDVDSGCAELSAEEPGSSFPPKAESDPEIATELESFPR